MRIYDTSRGFIHRCNNRCGIPLKCNQARDADSRRVQSCQFQHSGQLWLDAGLVCYFWSLIVEMQQAWAWIILEWPVSNWRKCRANVVCLHFASSGPLCAICGIDGALARVRCFRHSREWRKRPTFINASSAHYGLVGIPQLMQTSFHGRYHRSKIICRFGHSKATLILHNHARVRYVTSHHNDIATSWWRHSLVRFRSHCLFRIWKYPFTSLQRSRNIAIVNPKFLYFMTKTAYHRSMNHTMVSNLL